VPSLRRVGLLVGVWCLLFGLALPVIAADIQHENPDDADQDGDLEGVERWLSERLGDMHVDCTDGIRVGSYDACEQLDDEYAELLDQYATIENDLEGDTDSAEQFNETRTQQREYVALRQEFDSTFEEYEAARDAGNDAEARALARELQQLADRIEALGGEIEANFVELDGTVPTDFSDSSVAINESTEETRTVRLAVESESFDETNITATGNETASFSEPARITGNVTDNNGTEIPNSEVLLTDGNQTFRTTTAANGSYELQYRPAVTSVGETELTIQYQPETGDPYLSSETTATVTVTPTDATLTIENSTDRGGFNEWLNVTGEVQAAGMAAPDVNVTLRADDVTLAANQTGSDGRVRIDEQLPVTIEPGTQTLTLTASETDRALRPVQESIEFIVEETPTELRLTATPSDDGTIEVSGRLTTETDAAVGSRPITVAVGEESNTLETDNEGRFTASLQPASDADRVTATYDEPRTNLGASQAETTLETDTEILPAMLSAARGLIASLQQSPLISAGGVIVGIGVLALAVRWLSTRESTVRSDADPTAEADASTDTPEASPVSDSPTADTLLETARSKLQTDPQTAIYASYAAVRTLIDPGAAQTHRELYDSHAATEDDTTDEALYTLTEAFERAAFAADDVDSTHAKAALEAAERYLHSTHKEQSSEAPTGD